MTQPVAAWRKAALFLALSLAQATSVAATEQPGAPPTPKAWIERATTLLCAATPLTAEAAAEALSDARLIEDAPEQRRGVLFRLKRRFALPDGGELRIEHFRPGDRLRRFSATYVALAAPEQDPTPILQGLADGDCALRSGRKIRREGPAEVYLDQLDGDLTTLRWTETLEAPWPEGRDPGGPRVALIDSGLPYDLPVFSNRLARGADGTPLGYDFWDLDPHPYDADTSRGPFLLIRHGGPVASILAREAPSAALMPFRYPRPDMTRMAALVERAAQAGARIISAPLGGNRREDWESFAAALKAHPEILAIVSAGNNGRDLDITPVWPAALDLPNIITVTSADDFGRLARGSNWGAETVDVMLPAENQPVIDFRGAKGRASGSSYAVPRLAALAARILERRPDLSMEELKAAIFAHAVPSPFEPGKVKVGWIADPSEPLD